MLLSIFLARLIGIYLLVIALDLLFRRRELESAVKDFASSKGLLVFSGSLSLLFGLAIVISHPIFTLNWQGLISILGCLLILQGFLRITYPARTQKMVTGFFHKWYWLMFTIVTLLGAYLTLCGFYVT